MLNDPNHGMFTLRKAGAATDMRPQPRGVFLDNGATPLYSTWYDLAMRSTPGGSPTMEVVPAGATLGVVGHYINIAGDEWLEVGEDQWLAYKLHGRIFGHISHYAGGNP